MKGLKKFTPQEFERAVENCTRFFSAMGEEVRQVVAELGYERAQDLVGRSDLLVQSRAVDDDRPHRDDQARSRRCSTSSRSTCRRAEEQRERAGPDRRAPDPHGAEGASTRSLARGCRGGSVDPRACAAATLVRGRPT